MNLVMFFARMVQRGFAPQPFSGRRRHAAFESMLGGLPSATSSLRWAGALGVLALTVVSCSTAKPRLTETAEPNRDKLSRSANQPPAKTPGQLTGAELYALHCNRCHPERYAPERTPAQWQTILLHMRTRANLPAAQARAVLKFLQEDSGS